MFIALLINIPIHFILILFISLALRLQELSRSFIELLFEIIEKR